MLELMKDLPPGIEGLKAVGKLSKEDYERVFEPLLNDARREGRRVRLLYELGPEFEGFTPGAVWEDAKVGFGSIRQFDGCAIVTDLAWVRESMRLAGFFVPRPVRVFEVQEMDKAVEWLRSLAEVAGVSHRLLADRGVIVVEVNGPLRTQDFDALAATADAWIEAHGELHGLVIHAHEFPGWENVSAFFRHIRFVRDHHRKIKRIGLAADSKMASLVPRLAEHFIAAEVRPFQYDELDGAVAWASEASQ